MKRRTAQDRTALAKIFAQQIAVLATSLQPATVRGYQGTARNFLQYRRAQFPQLTKLSQLRRDPHIYGWLRSLCAQQPPRAKCYRLAHIIAASVGNGSVRRRSSLVRVVAVVCETGAEETKPVGERDPQCRSRLRARLWQARAPNQGAPPANQGNTPAAMPKAILDKLPSESLQTKSVIS